MIRPKLNNSYSCSFYENYAKFSKHAFCVFVIVLALLFATSKDARAQCCMCTIEYMGHSILSKSAAGITAGTITHHNFEALEDAAILGMSSNWNALEQGTFDALQDAFGAMGMRYYSLMNSFWAGRVEASIRDVASDLSAVATAQSQLTGKFFDAQHMMETTGLFQTLRAQAHNDYHPSVAMCEFASNTTTLFESQRNAEIGAYVLSQRSLDRVMNAVNTLSAAGNDTEKRARIELFKTTYCNPSDYDGRLDLMCSHAGGTGGADRTRHNRDIDFFKMMVEPSTLNVNFRASIAPQHNLTADETDIMSLAANLYNYDIPDPIPPSSFTQGAVGNLSNAQEQLMDRRAHFAKMSVAENSFNKIASKKFEGTPGGRQFALAVLQGLGMSTAEATEMLDGFTGGTLDPSYDMQMEILTKRLVQSPDFYTNLYGKPADVKRMGVALQAVALMQKFDLFESHLRNEANLSVLLELAVDEEQKRIEDAISGQSAGGQVVME